MAASTSPIYAPPSRFLRLVRGIGWFLLIPLTAAIILLGLSWWEVTAYQAQHVDKIYTGISIANVDVGGLTVTEANTRLSAVTTPIIGSDQQLTLLDPRTGQRWVRDSAELGIQTNYDTAIKSAFAIGRSGDEQTQLRDQFDTWYYGKTLPPTIVIDEQYIDQWLAEIAALIDQPAVDATLDIVGNEVVLTEGKVGYQLDRAATRAQLIEPLFNFQSAEIPLVINEIAPRVHEISGNATAIQNVIGSPMQLYIEQPLDGSDLQPVTIPVENLVNWMRIEWKERNGQSEPTVYLDEVAVGNWLQQFSADIYREPVRARFYFDDLTEELVLVEPHVSGRKLDVAGTVANIAAAVTSTDRAVPFVLEEIVPIVNSNVTGEELGIVELVTEATTSFAGSSPERMANIARSAENFYGIVIAPGEEFSFNKYLGEISSEQGYETGLIIFGGQTIAGIGGGVCQVSTTIYQAAFWGGFDIGSRVPHGYRVSYYEDAPANDGGSNIGMDATIYSPIVDFTFTNNTENYLLIENYYRADSQSLTFKIYSTDIGRKVAREVTIWNRTDPKPDLYRYNAEWLGEGFNQVEWATGGADVQVHRVVTNANGALRDEDFLNSSYVPWGNVYEFGPNTDQSRIPADAEVEY